MKAMTLEQAFKEFIESENFKAYSKGTDNNSAKYRVYLSRFKKGTLKSGALCEILIANGYEITANKAKKKAVNN